MSQFKFSVFKIVEIACNGVELLPTPIVYALSAVLILLSCALAWRIAAP
jgi:hypothetical protein